MTAKQRAARAKFKAVVAEAKKLRKKNPSLTQAQAVKQAWAISYSKAGKSKVGYSKARQTVNKNATAWLKNRKYTGKDDGESKKEKIQKAYELAPYGKPQKAVGKIKKKSATKVKARKSRSTEMHTDTKSHNVNIRVMSGIRDENLKQIDLINSNIIKWRRIMYVLEDDLFNAKSSQEKAAIKKEIRTAKYYIKTLEDTLKEIKKLVK